MIASIATVAPTRVHALDGSAAPLPTARTPLGELFDFEALADACAADGRYDFLLTSAPLWIQGGVGTPPNAIAIS